MVVGAEAAVARGARVRRLARVDAPVALEVAQLGEALAAVVADVPLLAGVHLSPGGPSVRHRRRVWLISDCATGESRQPRTAAAGHQRPW